MLYYGQEIDSTVLTTLNVIAMQQASPTQERMGTIKQILDFVASQEEAVLTNCASNMILTIHSDSGYINETKSQS